MKSYTRPPILKGKYPFSLPPDRAVYLTSVRDMGRLAGACLASGETPGTAGAGQRRFRCADAVAHGGRFRRRSGRPMRIRRRGC